MNIILKVVYRDGREEIIDDVYQYKTSFGWLNIITGFHVHGSKSIPSDLIASVEQV